MLVRYGRWGLDLVVLFFALYAFVFLPLGKRTGLDHLRALLGTAAAQEAGRELLEAGARMTRRLLGQGARIDTRGEPVVPELPPGEPAQLRLTANSREPPDAGVDASE